MKIHHFIPDDPARQQCDQCWHSSRHQRPSAKVSRKLAELAANVNGHHASSRECIRGHDSERSAPTALLVRPLRVVSVLLDIAERPWSWSCTALLYRVVLSYVANGGRPVCCSPKAWWCFSFSFVDLRLTFRYDRPIGCLHFSQPRRHFWSNLPQSIRFFRCLSRPA